MFIQLYELLYVQFCASYREAMSPSFTHPKSVIASIFAAFALAISTTLLASPASAIGTLDQQYVGNDFGYVQMYSDANFAQRFTSGRTGLLDRVTIDLEKYGNPGLLTMDLYAAANGIPTGTALASTSVQDSAVSNSTTTVNFDFSSPANVTAGSDYVLVLQSPNATSQSYLQNFMQNQMGGSPQIDGYFFSIGGVPPAAKQVLYEAGFNNWQNVNYGFRFSTFVTAVAVPSSLPSVSSSPSTSPSVSSSPSASSSMSSSLGTTSSASSPASLASTGTSVFALLLAAGFSLVLIGVVLNLTRNRRNHSE